QRDRAKAVLDGELSGLNTLGKRNFLLTREQFGVAHLPEIGIDEIARKISLTAGRGERYLLGFACFHHGERRRRRNNDLLAAFPFIDILDLAFSRGVRPIRLEIEAVSCGLPPPKGGAIGVLSYNWIHLQQSSKQQKLTWRVKLRRPDGRV